MILTKGETEKIEFKSSLSEKRQIIETIYDFSNKTGGLLFIGINDEKEVIGVDIGRNTLENLANEIRRETDPQISPSMGSLEIENIEQWGTGTGRIISSCLDQDLPEPIFEIRSGNVVVTLIKYKTI